MAATTAPSVKAALMSLLQDDSDMQGVQISYADPGPEIAQEALFFGKTLTTEGPVSMGNRRQQESYDIEIYIYVKVDGNDPQTAEERGWDLVSALEDLVRAENGNTGTLTAALQDRKFNPAAGWIVYAGTEMSPFRIGGARLVEALCKIHVEARK